MSSVSSQDDDDDDEAAAAKIDDGLGEFEIDNIDEYDDPEYGEDDYASNYFDDGEDDGDGNAYGKDGTSEHSADFIRSICKIHARISHFEFSVLQTVPRWIERNAHSRVHISSGRLTLHLYIL